MLAPNLVSYRGVAAKSERAVIGPSSTLEKVAISIQVTMDHQPHGPDKLTSRQPGRAHQWPVSNIAVSFAVTLVSTSARNFFHRARATQHTGEGLDSVGLGLKAACC